MATLDVTNHRKLRIAPPVAASAGIVATETVIAGASNAIPANHLKAGQNFRITAAGTCLVGTARVSTFALRVGPLGTVVDPVILTAATAASVDTTAAEVPFKAVYEFTVRTIGATASLAGSVTFYNTSATIGLQASSITIVPFTASTTFDSTVENYFMPTYKAAGAATTCTFQNVIVEMF